MSAPKTMYAAAIEALSASAAAFQRAKGLGLVWLDEEQGCLFAIEADVPAGPKNPDQLPLEGI